MTSLVIIFQAIRIWKICVELSLWVVFSENVIPQDCHDRFNQT